MTTEAWPRTARLDAPHLVERIAEITGVRLILEGPCPGGEVGAAYVRWPDGRRWVLNEGHTRTGPLLDRARAAGVPTARQELSAHIDGCRVIVQQRLPGTPPRTVDATLVRQMIALNTPARRAARRPARRPGRSTCYLTADGPGFCLHEPLAAHSPRTARLLGWIHEVGAAGSADRRRRPGAPGLPARQHAGRRRPGQRRRRLGRRRPRRPAPRPGHPAVRPDPAGHRT